MIIADGFDLEILDAVRAAFAAQGALPFVIAPRRHTIFPANSERGIVPDHHFEAVHSTMFDATFICPGAEAALTLGENGRMVHWVREAFGHLKAIGALGEGVAFLRESVVLPGVELAIDRESKNVTTSYGVVTGWKADAGLLKPLKIEPSAMAFSSALAHEVSKHRCYERELDGLVKKVAF